MVLSSEKHSVWKLKFFDNFVSYSNFCCDYFSDSSLAPDQRLTAADVTGKKARNSKHSLVFNIVIPKIMVFE